MPEHVLDPPQTASAAVAGSAARFLVRRIIRVGRNYAPHIWETGRGTDGSSKAPTSPS